MKQIADLFLRKTKDKQSRKWREWVPATMQAAEVVL
jgi:hypothetical protein